MQRRDFLTLSGLGLGAWLGAHRHAIPALADPATEAKVLAASPLGRIGTPDEIAGPVRFLCTDHANFITGEVFNVNGGAVLVG